MMGRLIDVDDLCRWLGVYESMQEIVRRRQEV